MELILWIVAGYLAISVLYLVVFYILINFNKKLITYWKNHIAELINEHPDLSAEAVETVLAASIFRSCIFWPELIFGWLKERFERRTE